MKRIDIFTIDIGGGHIAPAQAIKQQFDMLGRADLDVRVVNVGTQMNARFLRGVYKFYWNSALRYPPLINAFYRGADNPFLIKIVDRVMGISILPRFARYLEKEKPDLVVSTYFTFTHYLETLARVGQLDATSVVLNPEPFDAHYVWFSRALDWSMVFSQRSLEEIAEKGIPRSRLRLFPFPINPNFRKRAASKPELRRSLGLAEAPFTLLFFFGAEGRGPVRAYLDALQQHGLRAQVVVICGRNQGLKAYLDARAAAQRTALTLAVRGFVTNVSDYIAAADVVVGKSGPNQVFETLIQERPIIFSSFLANEKRTCDWVIENRLGWIARTPDRFAHLAARLAANPALIRKSEDNIRAMGLRSGTPEICDFLIELLAQRDQEGVRPRGVGRLRYATRKAMEDLRQTARDLGVATRSITDAAREAGRDIRDATREFTENARDATRDFTDAARTRFQQKPRGRGRKRR
jgi:UDP-N-acetylglucosamine:LPS N-acetylglucosamine transferase